MAKTISQYNEERYANTFQLKNDHDQADVIILYESVDDVVVHDAHYIVSDDFNGYVECLGKQNGCPACHYGDRGIRIQSKMFIPVYNVETGELLFWDRNVRFYNAQFESDVFRKYPNPSEYVWRITRHGETGSYDTRYSIVAVGRTPEGYSYDKILEENGLTKENLFERICKTWSVADYEKRLVETGGDSNIDSDSLPEFKISPRVTSSSDSPELPDFADIPDITEKSDPGEYQMPSKLSVDSTTDIVSEDNVDF